jgi:hypothetical protein
MNKERKREREKRRKIERRGEFFMPLYVRDDVVSYNFLCVHIFVFKGIVFSLMIFNIIEKKK